MAQVSVIYQRCLGGEDWINENTEACCAIEKDISHLKTIAAYVKNPQRSYE